MAFLHEVTFMLFFPRTAVCFSTKSETHIEVCFPVQHKAMILGKPSSDIFFYFQEPKYRCNLSPCFASLCRMQCVSSPQ